MMTACLKSVMQVLASNQISLAPHLLSFSLLLELSNLNALMIMNVPIQVSAMKTLSASHTPLLDQEERILPAAMTAIANQANSVTLDSAQTLEWDLSILIALQTMTVPILVSAMKILNASHTPLLDQVERILSAAITAIANQINSVTLDSAQTSEPDFSFQEKKETLVTKILSAFLEFVLQVPASHHQLLVPSEMLCRVSFLVKSCFVTLLDTDFLFIVRINSLNFSQNFFYR